MSVLASGVLAAMTGSVVLLRRLFSGEKKDEEEEKGSETAVEHVGDGVTIRVDCQQHFGSLDATSGGGGDDARAHLPPSGAGNVDMSWVSDDVRRALRDLLREHDVSEKHGFLPWPPPLQRLPCERNRLFRAWEEIVDDVPDLLAAGQFREAADKRLGRFPVHALRGDREMRRAMNVLCTVAHAYVWGNSFKLNSETQTDNCDFLKSSSSSSLPDYDSSSSPSSSHSSPSSPTVASALSSTSSSSAKPILSSSDSGSDETDADTSRSRKWAQRRRSGVRLAFVPRNDTEALSQLVLPKVIAKPWLAVCERVGRPPVLSHASYVLDNWRLINDDAAPPLPGASSTPNADGTVELQPRRHLITRDNVTALSYFLGGMDEMEFILRTVEIEEVGAIGVIAAIRAHIVLKRISGGEISPEHALDFLANACQDIRIGLEDMTRSMQKLPKRCDPYIFYTRVRPFLAGWKGNPVMPDGLMFEDNGRFQYHGGSAAQSSTLAVFDTILGVEHKTGFLQEMRVYMPPKHRDLLTKLAEYSLRDYAAKCSDARFRTEFNMVLGALEAFRNAHLAIVRLYIINPAKRLNGSKNGFKDTAGAKGTGGTDLVNFLKPLRDDTINTRV